MRHVLQHPESRVTPGVNVPPGPVYVREPAFQAFSILRAGFAALPIIAGADKFLHLLTDWNQYVAPIVARIVGGHVAAFMDVVGVVEIAAGVVVAARPRWGSALVGLWLCGIIVNLLILGSYFDIALRDLGLALGAFSLARLSVEYSEW